MNGVSHATVTLGLSGATLYACNSLGVPLEISNYVVLGCLAGVLIHPDLDQAEASKNPLLFPWWIYGKLMPHRSALSHFPIIGTAIRVMYMLLIVWMATRVFGIEFRYPPFDKLLPVFVGLCIADAGHFIVDLLSSFVKSWRSL